MELRRMEEEKNKYIEIVMPTDPRIKACSCGTRFMPFHFLQHDCFSCLSRMNRLVFYETGNLAKIKGIDTEGLFHD
jgi:hypothetical protein